MKAFSRFTFEVTPRKGDHPETILGIDIGGTKTSFLAMDLVSGRRIADASVDTPVDLEPAPFVALLRREANAMLTSAGVDPGSLRALGCAAPGQVDADGNVIGAGNLGWTDVPLRALVESEWGVPGFVDQDANAGALGEMWCGAAQGMREFVFLALGTGIGAGIVIDGRIHRGAHHAAGEVGDLIPDPRKVGTGARDEHNLASRLGSRALRRRARAATGQELHTSQIVGQAGAQAALAGVMDDVTKELATAVIAIASLIDPEAIVLGGGTAASGGEALLARVRAKVAPEIWIEPVLLLAALGAEAQLYGAIAGAMNRLSPRFVISK